MLYARPLSLMVAKCPPRSPHSRLLNANLRALRANLFQSSPVFGSLAISVVGSLTAVPLVGTLLCVRKNNITAPAAAMSSVHSSNITEWLRKYTIT